jgi:hypothetical protein
MSTAAAANPAAGHDKGLQLAALALPSGAAEDAGAAAEDKARTPRSPSSRAVENDGGGGGAPWLTMGCAANGFIAWGREPWRLSDRLIHNGSFNGPPLLGSVGSVERHWAGAFGDSVGGSGGSSGTGGGHRPNGFCDLVGDIAYRVAPLHFEVHRMFWCEGGEGGIA